MRALVVPRRRTRDPEALGVVRRWFAAWPLPFSSEREALTFFGGDTLRARAWCAGLERRADGLGRRSSRVLLDALLTGERARALGRLGAHPLSALVVRAADGGPAAEVQRMADALPGTTVAVIEDAGHDVHLDRPDRWRAAVQAFLAGL